MRYGTDDLRSLDLRIAIFPAKTHDVLREFPCFFSLDKVVQRLKLP